jgi:hypothetical protein
MLDHPSSRPGPDGLGERRCSAAAVYRRGRGMRSPAGMPRAKPSRFGICVILDLASTSVLTLDHRHGAIVIVGWCTAGSWREKAAEGGVMVRLDPSTSSMTTSRGSGNRPTMWLPLHGERSP